MFKYIKLADFLQTLILRKCQIKDLIYNQQQQKIKINHHKKIPEVQVKVNPGVAYSNLSLILNNINRFQQMFGELCKAMRKKKQKPITNKYLLFVMVAELINVGKIVGGGKLKKIVLQYSHLIPNISTESKINKQVINIRLRRCANNQQYLKWESILGDYEKNILIPQLYDLSSLQYSKLITSQPELRLTKACIIQSFSSNLPPFLLFNGISTPKNQLIKFDIIDTCSAPGNKTLQLSEYLKDRGTVYAFQKDQRRYRTLCKNIEKYESKNIEPLHQDFLKIDPLDNKYKRVKLILLDPSCSGSGMLTNFNRDGSKQISQQQLQMSFQQFVQYRYSRLQQDQKDRVQSLKNFQISILNHAAKFKPKRISYSTCSIFRQQNQQVVQQFLKSNSQYYIKQILRQLQVPQYMVCGFNQQFKRCVRVDPRLKISDGFFVTIFGLRKQSKSCQQLAIQ